MQQAVVTFGTVAYVLARLEERQRVLALEVARTMVEGATVIDVTPHELLLCELAGYSVDLETGEVEAIVLPDC